MPKILSGLLLTACVALYGCAGQPSKTALQEAGVDFQNEKEDSSGWRVGAKGKTHADDSVAQAGHHHRANAPIQTPKSHSVEGAATEIAFSSRRLTSRKVDPKLAQLFTRTARFMAGQQQITLFVNARRLGVMTASFNREGQLCLDGTFLTRARLTTPEAVSKATLGCDSPDDVDSSGFLSRYPQTVINLRPGKSEVDLIVPAEAILPRESTVRQFSSGGTAAMLNYDIFTQQSEFASKSSQYKSLSTVVGLNSGDWLFRSAQNYNSSATNSQLSHLSAFGQRTFSTIGTTVQGGQINIANSVFSGIPISGVQAVPEESLRAGASESPVRIEGMAHSPARVEVRQNGNLIHTSVIPEGPFLLTDVELNRRVDVLVTVIEDNGSIRSFTLPAASLDGSAFNSTPGYAFAVGRYRPGKNSLSETPIIMTGSGTWPLSQHTQVTAGALGSASFQSGAWSVGYRLTPEITVAISQLVSNSVKEARRGALVSASLSSQLRPGLSLSLSTTQQTEGYRDFQDSLYHSEYVEDILENGGSLKTLDRFKYRTRDQYGFSLGLGSTSVGSFSLSMSYSRTFGTQTRQNLSGSWFASYKRATFSVNVRKNIGNSGYDNGLSTDLSVSVPFGEKWRTYASADKNRTRTGATFRDSLSDSVSYQARVEHDDANHRTNLSASTRLLPRYAQANLGYSKSSADTSSYNARLSGAIVAHSKGVTLSPYPVGDTFSVLSVSDQSGVKIVTPQGPVWTDVFGQAIAPVLAPHRDNQLLVHNASLPRNVDVSNGVKKIKPSRGSVNRVEFDASTTRRTMLVVRDAKGQLLAKGLAIKDDQNQYITTTLSNGKVYFPTLEPGIKLNATLSEDEVCQIRYSQPKHADLSKLLETLSATCTAF